ncbi:MAG: NAD(P)/FAD-dependent oxidoreductase [Syntrophobacteraceae bacterium]
MALGSENNYRILNFTISIFRYSGSMMENFDILDVVIVGGGPAGLSAGIFAMRAAMKTVLIERGLPGGQMAISKDIDNYPGFRETNGFDLTDRFLEHVKGYGLEIIQREVLSIDPGEETHSILLEEGRTLTTRALIIATGGVARRLNIPGETENLGRGVSYKGSPYGMRLTE